MPLTLTIRNVGRLDNGSPLSLVLDRRGAVIGRAATTDWCLPDPSLHISSRHCELRFADGRYELIDNSTNGTFLYGQSARLAGPHVVAPGDVFLVGPFEIAAALDEASAAAAVQVNASAAEPEWRGWASLGHAEAPPAVSESSWDARPSGSAISGTGPLSENWASSGGASSGWGSVPAAPPPAAEPTWAAPDQGWGAAPPPPSSTWNTEAAPAATPASEWSAPIAPPPPPGANDIWGSFAQSNVVDWARGGFGSPPPPPVAAPAPAPTPVAAPAAPPPPAAAPSDGTALPRLLAAAGVDPARINQGEGPVMDQAGQLLHDMVAGLVVMLEARARAKAQMGAQGTNLEFDGNNPLKFARSPEQALAQLLNPAERGFMNSTRAVEDAFKDLQAHQMATLRAMQGALRATLERFSPRAIKARAETGGILSRIMPGARDAALWNAYEKEFSGVAIGSDEAFMDMFSKEFRRAYEELSQQR